MLYNSEKNHFLTLFFKKMVIICFELYYFPFSPNVPEWWTVITFLGVVKKSEENCLFKYIRIKKFFSELKARISKILFDSNISRSWLNNSVSNYSKFYINRYIDRKYR